MVKINNKETDKKRKEKYSYLPCQGVKQVIDKKIWKSVQTPDWYNRHVALMSGMEFLAIRVACTTVLLKID